MSIGRRRLDEDTSRQEDNLREAYLDLAEALHALRVESEAAARQAIRGGRSNRSGVVPVEVDSVHAAVNAFERAAELVDVRAYDLQKARGEHG